MAQSEPTWLSIKKSRSEAYETLVKRRLVPLEKTTTRWKKWPADTPSVAYDVEGDVVKYLPNPTGSTFEIELDQTFISATTPTGKWWYGNFTTTSGYNHVFTAEQEGQLDDNNSFTFLCNEDNWKILIEVDSLAGVNGVVSLYYENGNLATGFTINGIYYGNNYLSSRYYVITLPEPGTLTGDKVKIVFEEHQK